MIGRWASGRVFHRLVFAAASAMAMIVMGKISGKFDSRLLIAIGAMITVSAAISLSQINPDTDAHSLFVPLFLRGM